MALGRDGESQRGPARCSARRAGGLSSAPGCSTKQRHDRRRWAAMDADAEAAAQRARTVVEAAWMGLGGAALELKDQRLGAARSGWRGWRRWRRSSLVGGSSNQRVEGGPGTAWGGLEARASASVQSSGLAGAAWRWHGGTRQLG
jgi:hypothetical protein